MLEEGRFRKSDSAGRSYWL